MTWIARLSLWRFVEDLRLVKVGFLALCLRAVHQLSP